MSTSGAESLDARLVRFRSRGQVDDVEPLARDLMAVGRFAEAAEVAEALTEGRPESFDGWSLLASAREGDRDAAAAQKAWLEAARRSPARPEPYRHIADLLLARGDLDRAERIVARGLELAGADADLEERRARIGAERVRLAPPPVIQREPTPAPPSVAPVIQREPTPAPPPVAPVIQREPTPAPPPVAPVIQREPTPAPPPVAPVIQREPTPAPPPVAPVEAPREEVTALIRPADIRPNTHAARPIPPPRDDVTAVIKPAEMRRLSAPPLAGTPTVAVSTPSVPPPRMPTVPSREPTPGWPPAAPLVPALTVPSGVTAIPDGDGAVVAASRPAPPAPAVPLPPASNYDDGFDDDGATIVRSLEEMRTDYRTSSPHAAAAPTSASHGAAPSLRSSLDDEDGESTLVASRAELDQLRGIGAILPSNPPTRHTGQPWSDGSDEAPAMPSIPPPASLPTVEPVIETIRVRDDATLPFPNDGRSKPLGPVGTSPSNRPLGIEAIDASPAATETVEPAPQVEIPVVPTRSSKRPPARRKPALVLAGFALVGALGGMAAYRFKVHSDAVRRFEVATEALFSADSRALRSAHDAASALGSLASAAGRDLRLESDLIQFVEVGGLSLDTIRGDRVAARARGVSREWLAAATAVEALLAGDGVAAERALGPTTRLSADPRLAYVQAGLAARVGRRADARVLLAGLSRLTHDAPAVMLALAALDRAEGHPADAGQRLAAVLRAHPGHARAELETLSLALDGAGVAPAGAAARLEAAMRVVGSAEKAWFGAVLARSEVSASHAEAAAQHLESALRVPAAAPVVVLEIAAAEVALGRPADARTRLLAAFGAVPDDARARRWLGAALAALGRGDEALELLADDGSQAALEARALAALHASSVRARGIADTIAALGGSASTRLRAYELRLRLACGDDPATLLTRAQAMRGDHPEDRDVLVALAATAVAADRWDVLGESVDPHVRSAPEFAAWLARAAMRRGATAEAESALGVLASAAPDAPDTLVVRGYVQADKGEFEPALATYRDLVGTEGLVLEGPARVVGLVGQSQALLALGRNAEAQAAFDQLSAAEKASPLAVVAAARLAIVGGHPAEAITALEPLAALPTATPALLATFGDALYAVGETDRAAELYREALQLDGSLPEAQLGLAIVLVRAERFDEANNQLIRARRALDARPRGPAVEGLYFTMIGRTLLGTREVEEARYALRRAVRFAGVPAEAYFFLGESLAGANTPDATAAYERYLALAPGGYYADRATRALH